MPFTVEFVNTLTGDEGTIANGLLKDKARMLQQKLYDPDLITKVWYIDEKEIQMNRKTLLPMLMLLLVAAISFGATRTFTGAVDSAYEDPNNWAGGVLPAEGDDIINRVGLCVITSTTPVLNSVFITNDNMIATTPSVNVNINGNLRSDYVTIEDGALLDVRYTGVVNTGKITMRETVVGRGSGRIYMELGLINCDNIYGDDVGRISLHYGAVIDCAYGFYMEDPSKVYLYNNSRVDITWASRNHADLNGDGVVSLPDFAMFASNWLETN